ncbi:hypothetical protein KM043_016808 [Ampulex compressa]|nr:hypothetical protein KM043_016808 [Ampulex compressa]
MQAGSVVEAQDKYALASNTATLTISRPSRSTYAPPLLSFLHLRAYKKEIRRVRESSTAVSQGARILQVFVRQFGSQQTRRLARFLAVTGINYAGGLFAWLPSRAQPDPVALHGRDTYLRTYVRPSAFSAFDSERDRDGTVEVTAGRGRGRRPEGDIGPLPPPNLLEPSSSFSQASSGKNRA